jgi:hypothetical protein
VVVVARFHGYPFERKPTILFAAWADGTIVRNVDGVLRSGNVPLESVEALLAQMDGAGFFAPPLEFGVTHTDVAFTRISGRRGGRRQTLDFDGFTDFSDVGPYAKPSRKEYEAFVGMWRGVEKAVDAVKPTTLSDFNNDRPLLPPPPPWEKPSD